MCLVPGGRRRSSCGSTDEYGGYYDHVRPPRALLPDDIPPDITVPPDPPGRYDRYGFRVPAVVVSPYARPNHVSHTIRDHTAILKFIETKWNIGALTYRDANADDLLDCLDFRRPPAFLEPPTLPPLALAGSNPPPCTPGDPVTIPPPGAVTPRRGGAHTGSIAVAPAAGTRMGGPLAELWGRAGARR